MNSVVRFRLAITSVRNGVRAVSKHPSKLHGSASRVLSGLVLLVVLSVSQARAGGNPFLPDGVPDRGWPFIRSATFDAHSPEVHLADQWPVDGPPVLWTRPLGQGYSAFVAVGARVWTQTQTLTGQYVVCLDADSGETIWEHHYDWPYEAAGVYPGPRATPTFSDERIYFAGPNGLVGCLDAATGDEVWSVNVIEEYDGQGVGFGYACSPTVIDGLVLLPVGGHNASLVALDAKSGRQVWASGSDPASYTPALPIESDGRKLVVGYLQNSLVIADRMDGSLLARMDLSSGYDEHSTWPIFQDPHLWISGPFRSGSQLLTLPQAADATTVDASQEAASSSATAELPTLDTVWKSRTLSNDVTSSVLVDDFLYGFDIFDPQSKTHRPSRGIFRCVDFLSGEERWSIGTGRPRRENSEREADHEPEIGQSGIVVADGKLIIFNELGELILARPNPQRYEELARATVLSGELVWTPPILHRGRVYLRNHSHAVCVYLGEPELLDTGSQRVLSIKDVPQSQYRDLASTILAIEPEYAFDIPSDAWLWNWYFASLAILLASAAIASLAKRVTAPHRRDSAGRLTFRVTAFCLGLIGTTALSSWTQEFFFTWQVCLFVVFDAVAGSLRWTRRSTANRHRSLEWFNVALLIVVSLGYFLLCRRLSLVFEWVFLVGYPAALPFCRVATRFRNRTGPLSAVAGFLAMVAAFSAFYAAAVFVLSGRY